MIKNFEQLKAMLKAMPVKRKVAVVPAQDEHTPVSYTHLDVYKRQDYE